MTPFQTKEIYTTLGNHGLYKENKEKLCSTNWYGRYLTTANWDRYLGNPKYWHRKGHTKDEYITLIRTIYFLILTMPDTKHKFCHHN